MLYLVKPSGEMVWTDLSDELVKIAEDHGKDIADLPWRSDTDRTADSDVVAVALRHGRPCRTGIVVDAVDILDLYRPEEYREIVADSRKANAAVRATRIDDVIDSMAPGWKADGERLDQEVEGINTRTLARFEKRRSELLGAPPRDDLVSHWTSLGGSVI